MNIRKNGRIFKEKMSKHKSIYTQIAFSAITEMLNTGGTTEIESKDIPEKLNHKKACFVTLKNSDGSLRGCIGTLDPYQSSLMLEIIRNTISSAFHDSRFSPLTLDELNNIIISVEILEDSIIVKNEEELNPKIYGIIISAKQKRGVLLPNIEGVDTVKDQIRIVKRKAGIDEFDKEIVIRKFKTTKFH